MGVQIPGQPSTPEPLTGRRHIQYLTVVLGVILIAILATFAVSKPSVPFGIRDHALYNTPQILESLPRLDRASCVTTNSETLLVRNFGISINSPTDRVRAFDSTYRGGISFNLPSEQV